MNIKASIMSSVKTKLMIAMVIIAAIPLFTATTISYVSGTNSSKYSAVLR